MTTELVQQTKKQQELFYIYHHIGQLHQLRPRIKYESGKTSRVGLTNTQNLRNICHSLCCKKNISPQVLFKLDQLDRVFQNYEGLTAYKMDRVSDTSYKNAKAYLAVVKNNYDQIEIKETNSKKWYLVFLEA